MTIRRTVKRVLDGDTFQTYRKINGSNYVRLARVNAPKNISLEEEKQLKGSEDRFRARQLRCSQLAGLITELLQK